MHTLKGYLKRIVKGSPLLFCHHLSESHSFSAGDKGEIQPAGASLWAAAGFCGADLHHWVLFEVSRCLSPQELMQPGFSHKSTATKPASHCFTTGYQRCRASVQLSDRRGKKPEKPSWHCPFELSFSTTLTTALHMLLQQQEQQPVRKWAHMNPAMCLMDSGLLCIPSCSGVRHTWKSMDILAASSSGAWLFH